jgi:hypothetical protein
MEAAFIKNLTTAWRLSHRRTSRYCAIILSSPDGFTAIYQGVKSDVQHLHR